ncbi:MAG: peptidase [Gemmatimonadaceae bacterium]|nr:peptidase [Gemmatimonadaceae bacterium]
MKRSMFFLGCMSALFASAAPAQSRVTTPAEQFGHNIGDDYFLANYEQMIDYWQKIAKESSRVHLVRIGTSSDNRPMWMAIITSPENYRKLARYQEISRRLAHGDDMTDAQAHTLAAEGKAVVWIDGGLHATEVLGAQQIIETVYEMASRTDAETMRFLRDDILLAVPANPDGQDIVSNWYMQQPDTLKRTTSRLPVLYHKYVGHDNNRDAYMASQRETQAMDSILYRAWYPQIMYNHHQTGPTGTVIFAPPFRDPFNYNFDPLVPMELDLVGAAMHGRFVAEGKPGATMRSGQTYSTWWNGGMRTTVYFHNMIGLLTEAIGNPTPMEIPVVPSRQLPHGDLPMPITPQKWHFAQSMAYELTANRAVLDVASRYRETFLYNAWKMARNSIARGSTDSWTITPKKVAALKMALPDTTKEGSAGGLNSPAMAKWTAIMRNPADRDARGYIISANQPDFPTATKFVNALIKNGITVLRAGADFNVNGKSYPAGSFVVKTAQAFRPHVLDMFEPQDHPDDFPYPGAPPTPPYDNAGWTLAYQMGVEFDRVLEPFDGPFTPVTGFAQPSLQTGMPASSAAGFLLTRSENDAFTAVNRVLARGGSVYALASPITANDRRYELGTFYIPATDVTRKIIADTQREKGFIVGWTQAALAASSLRPVVPVRIALFDQYGGLLTAGWTRFIFDQFEFPYTVVYPQDIDAGAWKNNFDVLILPDGANLNGGSVTRRGASGGAQAINPNDIPAEYRNRLGSMSVSKSLPQIREFLEAGGTVLTVGTATSLAYDLKIPVASALVDSAGAALPDTKYYVPGSILSVQVDSTSPLALGMGSRADMYYDNAAAFRLLPGSEAAGVRRVAWIDTAAPLRSGWAWGQRYLKGATEVATAMVGKGTLILYGPDPYFRSQPHGTFKLFFNGIFYPSAK